MKIAAHTRYAAAVAAFLLGSFLLSFVGERASRFQAASQPALRANSLEAALGQGVLLGFFGGFRGIMADFAWVRGYVFWTRRDRAGYETYSRLSLALDPDNTEFRTGFADCIAFDEAAWEIREREGTRRGSLPQNEREKIRRRYAERGLAMLAEGAARLPEKEALFWWKSAIICSTRLKDWERAATFHRRAAEAKTNPVSSSELAYVSILANQLKRPADAVNWLRQRAQAAATQGDLTAAREYTNWANAIRR
jgi:hypothetical protein